MAIFSSIIAYRHKKKIDYYLFDKTLKVWFVMGTFGLLHEDYPIPSYFYQIEGEFDWFLDSLYPVGHYQNYDRFYHVLFKDGKKIDGFFDVEKFCTWNIIRTLVCTISGQSGINILHLFRMYLIYQAIHYNGLTISNLGEIMDKNNERKNIMSNKNYMIIREILNAKENNLCKFILKDLHHYFSLNNLLFCFILTNDIDSLRNLLKKK